MTPPIVPGWGNRHAKIIMVGEAPAKNEVREGRPFVGKAGQERDRLLSAVNLTPEDIYTTNACLEPVQGEKNKWFFESNGAPTQRFLQGIAALMSDINEIKPNVVVPLGNYALWAMMQHAEIIRWRGSILWSELMKVKVVPTIHPAALLWSDRDYGSGGLYKYRPVIIWDLERARDQSAFPEVKYRPRRIVVDPRPGTPDWDEAMERLHRAERLTTDIETFGGLNLACVGFSDYDPEWATVFSHDGTSARLELYRDLLETDIPKVGQNLMYDVTALDQLGIHVRNVVHDTMIAQHTILPDLPKGLDFMTSIYTDIPYYKDEGKSWKTQKNLMQFWNYNGKDICATTEIAIDQEKQLADDPQLAQIFRMEMRMFEPLRQSTYRGLRVDVPLLHTFIRETEELRVKLQNQLDKDVGYPVNVYSTPTVKTIVYEELKMPSRVRDGKLSVEAGVLLDLAAATRDPILTNIVKVRRLRKLLSNYYTEGILGPDGRLRFHWNIPGTKTFRLSATVPLWGPGMAIMTMPKTRAKKARKLFQADDGYEIGEFDQAQAEAVVTAYYANDPLFLDCFRTGKDVHRVIACLLVGEPMENWEKMSKDDPQRQTAKSCNHAFDYDMGPETFRYTVNEEWDPSDPDSFPMTSETAYALAGRYKEIRPALPGYWEWVRSELRRDRTLTNPLGWRRVFLDKWSDTMHRDAYAWIPQSTVGQSTNIGIIKALRHPEIQKAGVQLLLQMHDAAIFQWPREARDTVVPIIMHAMQVPLYINGYLVVVPLEGKVGQTWYGKDMDDLGITRNTTEIPSDEFQKLQDETIEALS